MRREIRIGLLAFLLSFSISFAASSFFVSHSIESRVQKHPRPALDVSDVIYTPGREIVTGLCTFGDCPVATLPATEMSFANTTQPETQSKTEQFAENVQKTAENSSNNVQTSVSAEELFLDGTEVNSCLPEQDAAAKNATVVDETQTTETEAGDDSFDGYIGRMYITGYTAEEGFPEGSATSSGYGVRPGYCAMNSDQRRALGISYGDRIYVEGLGTYTVMDCGCSWGVVDIWLYTNSEAYAITGYYNVYYAGYFS